MTRDAGEGRIGSSIDVACAARDPDALIVCAGVNRERSVVEGCPRPGGRGVARLTGSRESSGNMARGRCTWGLRLGAWRGGFWGGGGGFLGMGTGAGAGGGGGPHRGEGVCLC